MTTTIKIDAAQYADYDDCLTAAAEDYVSDHPEAEGEDDEREAILLDVPGTITVERVATSVATQTATGVRDGLDVDVTIELSDGRELSGEVTLVPAADGRPDYEAYGPSADYWVSGGLLRELSAAVGEDGLRDALLQIEAEAAAQCRRFL